MHGIQSKELAIIVPRNPNTARKTPQSGDLAAAIQSIRHLRERLKEMS